MIHKLDRANRTPAASLTMGHQRAGDRRRTRHLAALAAAVVALAVCWIRTWTWSYVEHRL